ncbi:MAG TPA: tetratricopeptide repeat protein [Burkholderiales bacterium]|nr:tetratricopeptide repeat protein [Burkholderiales bacterium]
MSLLMKALEKAAKDRGEARAEPVTPPAESRPELSLALELLAADTPSPRPRETRPADASTRTESAAGYYRSEAPRAAAVLQTAQEAERGVGRYLRDHPVILFAVFAGLFAIGFAGYVYLQIFHPGFFLRRAPAPVIPASVVERRPVPAASTAEPLPAASILTPTVATTAPSLLDPSLQSPPPPVPDAAPSAMPAESPPAPKPSVVRPAEKPAPAEPRIVVKRSDAGPVVNPRLAEAYAALQGGQLERAAQTYAELLRAERTNTDALLGLAAIALRAGRTDEAVERYRAILAIDPRHSLALSGLIAITGRADPITAESHLKELIAREPTAYTYFTLGNLYADQSLWAQAQQAYFQAHHLEPENPDYAYNLAVGLDHISQPRLALEFYRRALELAAGRSQLNFDPARARERIGALAARAE